MAKGNMLLGYSRGAVGDIVFARSKGQQVARARNRNPANPNTEAQVLQRSKFAAAQRFFQLANSQFFKFAYEDKSERESDYNAFMRHNVGISPYILREMTRQVDYPAFAPWMVTQGSLAHVDTSIQFVTADARWVVNPLSLTDTSITSVSALSSALIEGGAWRDGDIITVLLQMSQYGSYPLSITSGSSDVIHYTSNSRVLQLVLDTTDPRALSDVVRGFIDATRLVVMLDDFEEFADSHGAIACAVIHSRNTSTGLKVSTQSMVLNNDAAGGSLEGALASYNFTRSADYEGRILQSWDAASKAVLQGAKASVFNPPQIERIMYGGTPYLPSDFPVVLGEVAAGQTVGGIVIYTDDPRTLQNMLVLSGGIALDSIAAGTDSVELSLLMVTGDGFVKYNGENILALLIAS